MTGQPLKHSRPERLPVPSMVKDMRYHPPRWGVLRRCGPRAGFVQYGKSFKEDSRWAPLIYLQLVTPEEIEEARKREAEGLV